MFILITVIFNQDLIMFINPLTISFIIDLHMLQLKWTETEIDLIDRGGWATLIVLIESNSEAPIKVMFLWSVFWSNCEELPQMVENPLRKWSLLPLTVGRFTNGSTIWAENELNTSEFSEIQFGHFGTVEWFANHRMANSNWYCGQLGLDWH